MTPSLASGRPGRGGGRTRRHTCAQVARRGSPQTAQKLGGVGKTLPHRPRYAVGRWGRGVLIAVPAYGCGDGVAIIPPIPEAVWGRPRFVRRAVRRGASSSPHLPTGPVAG